MRFCLCGSASRRASTKLVLPDPFGPMKKVRGNQFTITFFNASKVSYNQAVDLDAAPHIATSVSSPQALRQQQLQILPLQCPN